ncbi:protein-methionine-sulfoxide reductase heme-binding subunit MsrQ [Oricola cellulosilytica]|uniref:Protein-methionine-sulfoxide reductase heme-binding subunit MsrQ n=1 Tax=Oricola cellulosilytica TaxID=1429082 RepID=A0A4R0P8I1_9HYPH|nr:protein-methionine-sulfoxide reductase heme-binding subunit MsrQ [Oricola cellulosilytica]TCD11876.1 protein-methionine-sulfoxide reductase heme-binding subunit MsrQ [Oricola cellulosilytica]
MAQSRYWTLMPEWLVYPIALLPAAHLLWGAVSNTLGPDPLKVLENGLGEWALRVLIAGLAITPIMRFLRINLIKYRRAIGLVAFIYVILHLSVYLVLDKQLDWAAIGADIVKRPYITIGMAAFVMLVPLAATSNKWSVRKLGSAAWRRLHRLVYVIAVFGAIHYLLLVKAWPPEPIIYLLIIVALLAVRLVRPQRRLRTAS